MKNLYLNTFEKDVVYLINDKIRPNNQIDKNNNRSNQGDKCKPQLIYYK